MLPRGLSHQGLGSATCNNDQGWQLTNTTAGRWASGGILLHARVRHPQLCRGIGLCDGRWPSEGILLQGRVRHQQACGGTGLCDYHSVRALSEVELGLSEIPISKLLSTKLPRMTAIRNEGRKTRSQGGVLEEKGKQEMEETLRSIYLDISEESEEQEGDRKDYVAEKRPTSGGKVGKWLKHSASVGAADDDVGEDVSEDEEDEEYDGSRGHGRGRRGRGTRGRGRHRAGREQYEEGYSVGVSGRKRGKKNMRRKLKEVEDAYVNETHPHIRRIIDHLEEEALQDQSDPEMADWETFLPDPGHTRGRMSLYKQSLRVYWGMKRLLARAMEQVAGEMVELARANIKKETKGLQMTLMMQDMKMDQLIQMLKDNGIVKAEPDTRTDDAMKS